MKRKERGYEHHAGFHLLSNEVLLTACETAMVYSSVKLSTFQAAGNLQYVALFINPELRYIVCVLELEARLFLLNHSSVSLRYYEMGFLPMLKETADVSVPL